MCVKTTHLLCYLLLDNTVQLYTQTCLITIIFVKDLPLLLHTNGTDVLNS